MIMIKLTNQHISRLERKNRDLKSMRNTENIQRMISENNHEILKNKLFLKHWSEIQTILEHIEDRDAFFADIDAAIGRSIATKNDDPIVSKHWVAQAQKNARKNSSSSGAGVIAAIVFFATIAYIEISEQPSGLILLGCLLLILFCAYRDGQLQGEENLRFLLNPILIIGGAIIGGVLLASSFLAVALPAALVTLNMVELSRRGY